MRDVNAAISLQQSRVMLREEKKVICNKFPQTASVSTLLWPEESRLIVGLMDGKVRVGSAHSNKSATLYKLDTAVVALAQHPNRRSFVSGHEDGSIVVYNLESRSQTKVCVHSTAPYCLVLSRFGILTAGSDCRIVSYNVENGRVMQEFDFRILENDNNAHGSGDFYTAIADPSGHSVLFGTFDRVQLLCWNERRGAWFEDTSLAIRNIHTITTLVWKPDGTIIVAGGSSGAIVQLDCCMRRTLLKNRFETIYISPSQVFIRDTKKDGGETNDGVVNGASCVVRSVKNHAITGLRVLGGMSHVRHFAVAHTPYTLIVADLQNSLSSEISWQWNGTERFNFENENVCLIVNAGEINFVEYGANEILGWIRTERVNPHLVSVRVSGTSADSLATSRRHITPRRNASARADRRTTRVCRVAYLLDVHTIAVVNLLNGAQEAHITHQNSIDWIELNESAQKLLFRDVGSSLYLHVLGDAGVSTTTTRCLLGYCSYAQWVPQSDVVVAQSGDQLCVWYSTDDAVSLASGDAHITAGFGGAAEQNAVRFAIQGSVEAVLRDEHRTEVIVVENNARVAYELDGAMIEFGTALNERDLSRALVFLERCERVQRARDTPTTTTTAADDGAVELTYELRPMWQRLADAALQNGALLIAQRCYVSLNDFPKVNFLQETIERADFALQQKQSQSQLTLANSYHQHDDMLLDDKPPTILAAGGALGECASATDVATYFESRARVALLNKDFKLAERIYLENNAHAEAIEIYKRLGQWDAAIALANATGYARLDSLRSDYFKMLNSTGQLDKAAEIRLQEGDLRGALRLYLDASRPAQAARLILDARDDGAMLADTTLVEGVIDALLRHEQYERAGDLFEATHRFERAIEYFRRAKNFAKAIHVARRAHPDMVVELELEWANALYANGNYEAAISHYLEGGQSLKAADASIRAKEWTRAIEILHAQRANVDDDVDEAISGFYAEIARHFEADGEYEKAEKFYVDGGKPADAIEMYNRVARWTDAYKLAADCFGEDESRELYAQKAEELEREGRLAEAEQLYVNVGEPNRAIAMYKTAGRHDDMMRLVERYHANKRDEMHRRLAEEFEENGDLKAAEEHYLAANDWNSALEMYRDAGQFEDAFRVAKAAADAPDGGVTATRASAAVAYAWAKSIGGDAAVKLLTRHALLHDAIDIGLIKNEFEFVFELCNFGAKDRLAEAYQKYAEHLEDDGDFAKAEESYLKAGKSREAVLMHMHNQDWQAAERVASAHAADALPDVLVARGRVALEANRIADAESYFLRASRADLIIAHYCEAGAWTDALRVATKYAPDGVPQLEDEFARAQAAAGGRGTASAQVFTEQAAEWERQGDYQRAVDCYLKVDADIVDDMEIVAHAQAKAAELIVKFLATNEGLERVRKIGDNVARIGRRTAAAEIFLLAKMPERAVEELIAAEEWTRARRIAGELSPAQLNAVERAYRESLRAQGRVGELADVDARAAIDLMAERGEWDSALNAARQQNDRALLDRHLMARAAQLVDAGDFRAAVRLFLQYGTSLNLQAFNFYKYILDMTVNRRECDYETYSTLRDMLADLNKNLRKDASVDRRILQIFERYEFAMHLYALHDALSPFCAVQSSVRDVDALDADMRMTVNRLRMQQSIALLRYVDLFQPDKIFYEAGMACKEFGAEYENLGFVLLNHCLDVAEAIEEGDATLVDNSIFQGTDVPQSYAIPGESFLTPVELEEAKEWVLATSVGRNIAKELKMDARGTFEASTLDPGSQDDDEDHRRAVCAISGYPILDSMRVKELSHNMLADQIAWGVFINLTHVPVADDRIFDVQAYLNK